jgi:penicillin amidase
MKKWKLVLKILGTLIVILVLVLFAFIYHLKPSYSGNVNIKNLAKETTVFFDDYGIPHIYAQSKKDAMIALGYVHAQDRLWQMELMRRIAPGRLSELFGSLALKNDKFFAGLGIEEASAKAIAQLDKNSEAYQLAIAYLDGINQFIENGPTPIEFYLVGVKKEKYELKDIYNVFGYMSFSFAMAQKTDPLLSEIREKLGDTYIKDLGITVDPKTTTLIKNAKEKNNGYGEISAAVNSLLEQSPVPPFIGSNSWVVGAQKTKNGKVIFANDPHIAYSQPSVWYEAHIQTPDYEMYGYHLAGVPFPLLGHNRNYAYGLTMFENDDLDFYKEENNPADKNQYKTPEGWKSYEIVKKTIKVKNEKDVVLEVKISRHGPVVNDLIEGITQKEPLAMSWIYTQQPIKTLEAVYQISHANNKEEFRKGVSLIAAPGLNVMYGDAKGNIAWWATGKLYKNKSGANRNFILDGSSGNDDISEYLDFDVNPSATNPKWNYVYSANNQPDSIAGFLYPGYYVPEDRARRIVQLLEPKNDWDKDAISSMITDITNPVAPENIKELISVVNFNVLSQQEQKALNILKAWNGAANLQDVAPTIYNRWIYQVLKNTYEDELGETNFKRLLTTHLIKSNVSKQIKNNTSVWWDNVLTKNRVESRSEILTQSFIESIALLEKQLGKDITTWTWNKVSTVEHQHPLGKVPALRKYFNVGPFEMKGANEVINNMITPFTETGEYHIVAGPSTRRVIDFSDIENSRSVLPTGESGNVFSKHYKDQALMYNNGEFRKMKLNKEEIIQSSTKLILTPKN